MKLFLFLLLPGFVNAQAIRKIFPVKDSSVHYEKVFEIDSTSKDELFKRSKVWALSSFKSQKSALQSEDKDLGFLFFNSFFSDFFNYGKMSGVTLSSSVQYWFNFKVYIKDNKVKVVVDNVRMKQDQSNVETDVLDLDKNYDLVTASLPKNQKDMMKKYMSALESSLVKTDTQIRSFIDDFETAIKKSSEFDF